MSSFHLRASAACDASVAVAWARRGELLHPRTERGRVACPGALVLVGAAVPDESARAPCHARADDGYALRESGSQSANPNFAGRTEVPDALRGCLRQDRSQGDGARQKHLRLRVRPREVHSQGARAGGAQLALRRLHRHCAGRTEGRREVPYNSGLIRGWAIEGRTSLGRCGRGTESLRPEVGINHTRPPGTSDLKRRVSTNPDLSRDLKGRRRERFACGASPSRCPRAASRPCHTRSSSAPASESLSGIGKERHRKRNVRGAVP